MSKLEIYVKLDYGLPGTLEPIMRTAVLGDSPGRLKFAILLKTSDPSHHVLVIERNRPDDASTEALCFRTKRPAISPATTSARTIRNNFVYWDNIAVRHRAEVQVYGGNGFCGAGRKKLPNLLQARGPQASTTSTSRPSPPAKAFAVV